MLEVPALAKWCRNLDKTEERERIVQIDRIDEIAENSSSRGDSKQSKKLRALCDQQHLLGLRGEL
jgi:hypothetical protein